MINSFFSRRIKAPLMQSIAGLKIATQTEEAVRIELIFLILLIPTAFLIGDNAAEKGLLTFSTLLILIVELINSANEKTVDRISTDIHSMSKIAKDLGSSAVLFSIINFLIVWAIIIFIP